MPRDVSLSDSKCFNGGHEWVKKNYCLKCNIYQSYLKAKFTSVTIRFYLKDDIPVEVRCARTDSAFRERCRAHAGVKLFLSKKLKPNVFIIDG